jgi:hypothetical protein
MRFIKQLKPGICQLIAVQIAMTFYDIEISLKEIKARLPKHSFGNLPTELGLFFNDLGIKSKLISNQLVEEMNNKLLVYTLKEYSKLNEFKDRKVTVNDLGSGPIIINVDWYKVKNKEGGPGGHYVVCLIEKGQFWLYDGSNHNHRVQIYFDQLYKMSLDINRYHHNGMWLILNNSISE